ncbi:TlpA disulfide reductase family protein [Limibacter armeniacum]|uniref:TlpA family protein disulfide reductase n=1 Tax=Limibacter armeniacum TaxID=466084 RepID=UPI002FE5EE7A
MKPNINEEGFGKADYNLQLEDMEGDVMSLQDLKGKTLFINFWATWCPPCVAEMPEIYELYSEMKNEEIAFVMISVDEDPLKLQKFLERKAYDFPVYQLKSSVPEVFQSSSVPTTFIVSPDGKIVLKHAGMASYNNDKVKTLLRNISD